MTTEEYTFIYTWEEWDQILEENSYDQIIDCPRCEEEGNAIDIAECPCLTMEMVENEGWETCEKEGRLWAKRPPLGEE